MQTGYMAHRELGERPLKVDGRWTLPIGDGTISQISVDHAFSLVVDSDTVIRFETPFSWFDGTTEHTIDPSQPESLGPLVHLVHQEVSEVSVTEPGSHLAVTLSDGQWLRSSAHDQYEAWTATATWGIPEERSFFVATQGG